MFRFRLQHVLEVRERLERLKQKDHALALLEWQSLVTEIDRRQRTMTQAAGHVDSLKQTSPTMMPILLHSNYRKRLQAEVERLREQVREQEQVLELKRRELVETRRARRTLEILRDKQRERYEQRQQRLERATMDEVAANYHTFNGRTHAVRRGAAREIAMSRLKAGTLAVTLGCAMIMTATPARYSFGMSKVKSWVNTVRPGTFPDMESASKTEDKAGPAKAAPAETLTENERQILLSLMERKRQLDERDSLLNQREEQLRVLRDNIQHQVAELKRLQGEIEASMEAKKAQDAENLKKVVVLYNGMDPKKAAQKLQTLEPRVAMQILMAMNQRKASQILQELPADNAKRITEEIVRKVPIAN
jgi:flagellar export protein FliJ